MRSGVVARKHVVSRVRIGHSMPPEVRKLKAGGKYVHPAVDHRPHGPELDPSSPEYRKRADNVLDNGAASVLDVPQC
jgi:hypothetical protein